MTAPATTFAGGASPFTGPGTLPALQAAAAARRAIAAPPLPPEPVQVAKPAKPKTVPVVDAGVGCLEVCDDPFPAGRAAPDQHAAVFDTLKVGQCVKCHPDQVIAIAAAMRKWVKSRGRACIVRGIARYTTDGQGRVWLLADPKARARGGK